MFRNAMNFLKANAFLKDRRGNIAPIFALSLIPTVGMIGAAIDLLRANNIRAAMQASLDSTTLAMAGAASTVETEKTEDGRQGLLQFNLQETRHHSRQCRGHLYDDQRLAARDEGRYQRHDTVHEPARPRHQVHPDQRTIDHDMGQYAPACRACARQYRVDGLQQQDDGAENRRKGLIDQLKTAATKDGDVYVSIVPFAKDVNVGNGNKDAAWLKWGSNWDDTKYFCSKSKYASKKNAKTTKEHGKPPPGSVDRLCG